jgi:cell division protein FtsL
MAQSREKTMLEYDQNLPQEFANKPKRIGTGTMVVLLTLATVVLVYALVTLLPIISHYRV